MIANAITERQIYANCEGENTLGWSKKGITVDEYQTFKWRYNRKEPFKTPISIHTDYPRYSWIRGLVIFYINHSVLLTSVYVIQANYLFTINCDCGLRVEQIIRKYQVIPKMRHVSWHTTSHNIFQLTFIEWKTNLYSTTAFVFNSTSVNVKPFTTEFHPRSFDFIW